MLEGHKEKGGATTEQTNSLRGVVVISKAQIKGTVGPENGPMKEGEESFQRNIELATLGPKPSADNL